MATVVMMIEKTSDFYDAYSVNCDGIYSAGATIEELRDNTLEAINLLKKNLPKERWPKEIEGDFEISFEFDTASFLEYYGKQFTFAGLQEITGINQKQLSNYANRRSVPRKEQREKINRGIHRFAEELLSVSV